MQAFLSRKFTLVLGTLLAIAMAWVLSYHECASGGAMGGRYRDCVCRGIEHVDFDNTDADGPLRTVCIGWVTARTCYRDRGGREMPCERIER